MEKQRIGIQRIRALSIQQIVSFVQKANEFESRIWVEYESHKMNAKSLLGMLNIGLQPEKTVVLEAAGIDQLDALEDLSRLLQSEAAAV